MNESKETLILISVSAIIFFVCTFTAFSILPEHCELFSNNIDGGFMCDGLDITNPKPCPICEDQRTAAVATFLTAFGFISLLIPFAVYEIKNQRRISNKQIKLFT